MDLKPGIWIFPSLAPKSSREQGGLFVVIHAHSCCWVHLAERWLRHRLAWAATKQDEEPAICPGNLAGKQSGDTQTPLLPCLSSSVISAPAVHSYSTGRQQYFGTNKEMFNCFQTSSGADMCAVCSRSGSCRQRLIGIHPSAWAGGSGAVCWAVKHSQPERTASDKMQGMLHSRAVLNA